MKENTTTPNSVILDKSANYRLTALQIARTYVGQKEVGRNGGKFVDDCLKLVGLGTGFAWCQAFVYRCYHEAAISLKIPNTCFRTAGVLNCWNNTAPNRRILKKDATHLNILAGYQFIMDYGKGLGHTGIVIAVNADKTFTAIEGNTNESGSREGDRVAVKVRSINDAKLRGFIVY
jgi:hypothetical protein